MDDLRKAAEMALKYFEDAYGLEDTEVAIREALRQALAEPEDPRIVELRTLMAEPTVTGVIFEVHRGPLSKSIREFGECPCPTQEPVGYAHVDDLKREHHDFYVNREQGVNEVPLYTAPQKQWVGLTDKEIQVERHKVDPTAGWTYDHFARAIEAKLRGKNT